MIQNNVGKIRVRSVRLPPYLLPKPAHHGVPACPGPRVSSSSQGRHLVGEMDLQHGWVIPVPLNYIKQPKLSITNMTKKSGIGHLSGSDGWVSAFGFGHDPKGPGIEPPQAPCLAESLLLPLFLPTAPPACACSLSVI